ncbi:kinesin-like protein KIF22 isoform X1 [Bufo gargarizans]|uniref:kinesin-like protein KIF22 isoform X1 n=1 Tax=Bufo gargarizans TaxID=30331 RepID=UPI001CF49F6B|nr:kinesin-like protein KIF22 isoform X1 [Bufo gargarizans]
MGKMEMQLLTTPRRERMVLMKQLEETRLEIARLRVEQKEKSLAAEALEKSNNSHLELSDSSVSESIFREPMMTRSAAKTKKVLRVLPLHGTKLGVFTVEEQLSGTSLARDFNLNTKEEGIIVIEKKTQGTPTGCENMPGWELTLRTDLLQNGREKLLNLLNEGSITELKSLQKIWDKKAKLIVGWREVNGPFKNLEDLASIEGISAKFVDIFLEANILRIVAR